MNRRQRSISRTPKHAYRAFLSAVRTATEFIEDLAEDVAFAAIDVLESAALLGGQVVIWMVMAGFLKPVWWTVRTLGWRVGVGCLTLCFCT